MSEQMEKLIEAARGLLGAPTAERCSGTGSADWYRRAISRMEAVRKLRDTLDVALDALKEEARRTREEMLLAEAAVLEDARVGVVK